jgi:hypothetical protein
MTIIAMMTGAGTTGIVQTAITSVRRMTVICRSTIKALLARPLCKVYVTLCLSKVYFHISIIFFWNFG